MESSGVSHYPTHRVMSRRRYGVLSEGNKFKRLSRLPEWGFKAFRSAVLEGTNTLPKPGQVSRDSNNGKSAEDVVPSGGEPSKGDPEEDDAPAEDKPAEGEAQEGEERQEEKEMKITVRRGRKKTRAFSVNSSDQVVDLQRKIHSWSKVALEDQRLFYNGIPLHPALGLDSLWDGITTPWQRACSAEQASSAGERRRREAGRNLPSARRGSATQRQRQTASTRRQSG